MDEQRFVVEITRPVPPEKVALVAERIAQRLRMDPGRIVTLLEGRTGPVTKPVLPEKADAIAEVFAQAGVRVLVMAAPLEPPPYVERLGAQETADEAPADDRTPREPPRDEPPDAPPHEDPPHVTEVHVHARAADDVPPWDEAASWGFDSEVADEWKPRSRATPRPDDGPGPGEPEAIPDEDSGTDPAAALDANLGAGLQSVLDEAPRPAASGERDGAPEEVPDPGTSQFPDSTTDPYRFHGSGGDEYGFDPEDDPEEEADRLGPSGSRAGAGAASSAAYSNAPRWVPSTREPDDRPAASGFYAPGDGRATGHDDGWDAEPPREGPRLRTYLLWALILSLLLLVLLQFVVAKRSDLGVASGAFEAGMDAYRKGDFAAAERLWEPLAQGGDARTQYLLGFMAQNGLGQPWSNAQAAGWYRRAAQQGLPQAQMALGDLYLRGMGVEQDARVGAAWYGSAAVAGHPEGQLAYAKLLLHGTGVAQDFGAALAWFEAAAAAGVSEAADYVAYARALADGGE